MSKRSIPDRVVRADRPYGIRALIEGLEDRRLLSTSLEADVPMGVAAGLAMTATSSSAAAPGGTTTAESASTEVPAAAAVAAVVSGPSVLHTEADFDRMRDKVAAGAQPWLAGWNALIGDAYSQTGWNPRPTATVIRGGDGQNFGGMIVDMLRAYQTAVRWKVSGDTHAYLFFTDDHGRFYRSRTKLADFPRGFDEPVVVLQEKVARELFEGSSTYRIKGTNQYLTLIEAANENWTRYFKAFIADGLDGEWRPLAAEWGSSFADDTRVRSHDGKPLWTKGISHGELLRDGYDQTLTIDPANLNLLYQGLRPGWDPKLDYIRLPYQLGVLRRELKPQ